jgi:hypothetical protein
MTKPALILASGASAVTSVLAPARCPSHRGRGSGR